MKKKQPHTDKTTIPLPVLLGETRTMYCWCQADKKELVSNGFNWDVVESLPELCNNSETLLLDLDIETLSLSQYRRKLKNEFKAASHKRTQICKKIRYALLVAKSNHKIPGHYQRRAYPLIIEDLFNLATLCGHFKDELALTGFDQNEAVSLKELSLQLQNEDVALGALEIDCRALRKDFICAYKKLYSSAQTLRNCAFAVFPLDSPRRNGYYSRYRKEHR
jgi:hypothetical protein